MVGEGNPKCASIFVVVFALCAGSVQAATVVVSPGPGTPLQTAIALADPGSTIRLGEGVFHEAVTVTKRLRLVGAFDGSAHDRTTPNLTTIDAGCAAPYGIDVAADHVRLERLDVIRGTEGGVRIFGRDKVQVWDLRPRAVQGDAAASCGTERFGLNVSGGGKIKLAGGTVAGNAAAHPTGLGFLTAGIRLADVVSTGRVDVRDYACTGNAVGVLVEDSVGPGVKLRDLVITAADTGILLHNADVVTVRSSTVNSANGLSAEVGVRVDATSNGNRLSGNELTGSGTDVLDLGLGNCWRKNVFVTGSLPLFNCL